MRNIIRLTCAAVTLAALSTLPLTTADAQKRSSISSTKTIGKKKGGPSIYKAHKLPKKKRTTKRKSNRRNAIRISSSQITLNAELNARRSNASSVLSRAPLGPAPKPKIDTSRMSMDVNTARGVRLKPIKPPPPSGSPPPLPRSGR